MKEMPVAGDTILNLKRLYIQRKSYDSIKKTSNASLLKKVNNLIGVLLKNLTLSYPQSVSSNLLMYLSLHYGLVV